MKVAIIGAGVCGLYLAWKLAERGEKVSVFEKKSLIGKEVCSGLFSERILELIPYLSKEYSSLQKPNSQQGDKEKVLESQKLIENQINYCLIHWGPLQREGEGWVGVSKKTLKVEFKKKFLVMSHFELDNLLANLAQKAGAKIILNQAIRKEDISKLKNDFDRIIGCDGAISVVRKYLGMAPLDFRLGIQGFLNRKKSTNISDICAQIKDDSQLVETWPTQNGFIWKIPRGQKIEYGIIEIPKVAKFLFEKFLRENNLQLENLKSALIPQFPKPKYWWGGQGLIIPKNKKITLCGDAAGLTKPWSGGGVVWSLMAANFLLKNFPDFIKYQKAVKKFFLPKIIFSKITTKAVYFLGFNFPWFFPKNIKIENDFLI